MGESMHQLTPKTVAVLEMIAAGCSYEQILAAYPDLTYLDIFRAASEVLDAMSGQRTDATYQVAEIRKSYPRAYEQWTQREETHLRRFIDEGLTVAQIAGRLQRQRSAIRARIMKLDLVGRLNPKEQASLLRIIKLDAKPADPSDDDEETGTQSRDSRPYPP